VQKLLGKNSPWRAGVAKLAVRLNNFAGELFPHGIHAFLAEELKGCADGKVGQGFWALKTELAQSVAVFRKAAHSKEAILSKMLHTLTATIAVNLAREPSTS